LRVGRAEVGGCVAAFRIAFSLRFGRPRGRLVGLAIRRASGVFHVGAMSANARFMFMAVTTNRRWQALRASPR
jgi:hypothetical protein